MILCLSGNGNSLQVARLLARHLPGETVKPMVKPELWAPAQGAERVIWVMPVHSWGPPVAFFELVNELSPRTFAPTAVHHLVLTYGDDCGHAHRLWQGMLASRGWTTGGMWGVQMPNTYVLLPGFDVDSAELAGAKLQAAPERVARIAEAIAAGTPQASADLVQGSVPRLKTRLVYPLFARYDINPAKFRVDPDACIGCGRCVKACPLDNITLDADRHPRWDSRCTQCLGCYNVCPAHAIAYGRRTRHKGQFHNPAGFGNE